MKKKEEPTFAENSEEEKVISLKRVVIASIVCVTLVSGFIWSITRVSEIIVATGQSVLGVHSSEVPDTVRLPQREDANIIAAYAKEYVSDISFDEVTSSESAVQTIIATLQELQSSDSGLEDFVCSFICN